MRGLKSLLCTSAFLAPVALVPASTGQVSISIGAQPICSYGYYDYSPYACAPVGFYGPGYFYNGIFLGVGPWSNWGYNHGWGNHRFTNGGGGRYNGEGGYEANRGHGGGGASVARNTSPGRTVSHSAPSSDSIHASGTHSTNQSHAAATHDNTAYATVAPRNAQSHEVSHSVATHGDASHGNESHGGGGGGAHSGGGHN